MAAKDEKHDKILRTLKDAPHGLWVREVARRTGIDKSTCSRCLEAMGNEVGFEWLGRNKVFRLTGK